MRTPLVFFLLLGYVSTATAQPSPTVSDEPLSDRRVSYDLAVTLDPEARTVTGLERVTWRNPDRVPVDELQFHLYLNAFSGPNSTFMRESGGGHRGFRAEGTDPWGSLEITRVHADIPGDIVFPAIDPGVWHEIARMERVAGPDDDADMTFVTYRRVAAA